MTALSVQLSINRGDAMRAMIMLLGLLASSVALAEDKVYMLGKLKVKDSTYVSVVFFQDPAVNTIAICEREVMYGRNGQWQYFAHLVHKVQGVSLTVDYFCRSTANPVAVWQPRDPYDYVYLVDIRNDGLKMTEFDTYADCVGSLKKNRTPETFDYFCAKSNQHMSKS